MKNPLYNVIPSLKMKKNNSCYSKLDKVLLYLQKKHHIVSTCKKVGSGAYGSVFQISENKVLKITQDPSECNTMSILKKNPCINIVKVFDVFKSRINRRVYYFIVEEKLIKATKKWKYFANYYQWHGRFITTRSVKKGQKLHAPEEKNKDQYKWISNIAEYFDRHHIKFFDLHGGNIMRRSDRHVLIDLGVSKAPKQEVIFI